ncbi:hypothetical protein Tco_0681338 [Tanacetum coccineum]|uniref:Uncharacterized protein n=1 Tax=Tanacetum coccineum TaxID=301880 RepID=A0ABQ4XN35_9ASTR
MVIIDMVLEPLLLEIDITCCCGVEECQKEKEVRLVHTMAAWKQWRKKINTMSSIKKLIGVKFLVGVKFEEQNVMYKEVDPAGADAPMQLSEMSTTICEYFYKKDMNIVNEELWSDSNESAYEEMNESCLMAFGSQELYLWKKHILQQKTNKLANRSKKLELEFHEATCIKTKEVVEPCLSCGKLTDVVGSLKDDVLRLQDEALRRPFPRV